MLRRKTIIRKTGTAAIAAVPVFEPRKDIDCGNKRNEKMREIKDLFSESCAMDSNNAAVGIRDFYVTLRGGRTRLAGILLGGNINWF